MTARGGPRLVVRNAEVDGHAQLVDVEVIGDTIAGIVPSSTTRVAAGTHDAVTLDAAGGALIAGLHDHHIHLLALAAARRSMVVESDFATRLSERARGGTGWLRAVGYHESICGPIDRAWLDRWSPDRPVRVQHRSGAMWVLNSRAVDELGIEVPNGVLVGGDDLLRDRIPAEPLDLDSMAVDLAAMGVVGVTDLTPTESSADLDLLAATFGRDGCPIDVVVTGGPDLDPAAASSLSRGPVKVVVGDHALPTLDDLIERFRAVRQRRRPVAVHCVTRVGLLLALAAWDAVGVMPGDRIEHGAVVPIELVPQLAALGLTVVTQPSFVHERGDAYLAEVDLDDQPHLWRCASLLGAGVPVGASTDAPFGDPDPWKAIAAATNRRTRSGAVLGADERISARRALAAFQSPADAPGGAPRRVSVGARGGLCLLHVPLDVALSAPSSDAVRATVGRGTLTVDQPSSRR